MAIKSDYISGTLTITQGAIAFTGTGTGWESAGFKEGDTLIDITGATEYMGVVESITGEATGTLTKPWEGPTLTNVPYRMRYQPDGARSTAQARNLIEILGNGNITAFALLNGAANLLPMFTGAGAMTLVTRQALVSGAAYDVQVNTLPDRAAYDGQDQGFSVLVANIGDGRAAIYSKNSATSGDWSDPAFVTGPVGPVVTINAGTTTTLPTGQDATVDIRPVTGGYEIDFGIPRGIKGDAGTDGANGAMGPSGPKGDGLVIGASGTLANRDNYDNEPENFAYVDSENGNLYFRETSTPGVWSDPIPFGEGPPGADGSIITTSSGTGNGTVGPYTLDQAPLGLDNVIIASISGVTQYNYTVAASNPPTITFSIPVPTGVAWEVKQAGPLSLGTADAVSPGVINAGSISDDEIEQEQILEKIGGVAGPTSSANNTVAIFDGTTGKLIKDSGILIEDIGSGDVVGPASAVDERIAVFDGTTGKLLKDGGISIAEISGIPLGVPMPIISNVLPEGYLWLEGGTYDPLVYPEFNTYMVNAGYVSGQLPDWRNRVPRGLGTLTSAVGTLQEDAFQGHWHETIYQGGGGSVIRFVSDGTGTGAFLGITATPQARTPISDGTNGTPRVASETRAKAFIVRWAVKAYGAIVNAGTADLVEIEQALTHAIRDDQNQNAQAKSSALKINILKNTLQAWEQIGSEITVTSGTVAQIDWTDLNAYRKLRLTGKLIPTAAGSQASMRIGAGSFDTANNYNYNVLNFFSSSTTPANGVYSSLVIAGNNSDTGAIGTMFTSTLEDFNQNTICTALGSSQVVFSGVRTGSIITSTHNAVAGRDRVRLFYTATTIAAGSTVILEGIRG